MPAVNPADGVHEHTTDQHPPRAAGRREVLVHTAWAGWYYDTEPETEGIQ